MHTAARPQLEARAAALPGGGRAGQVAGGDPAGAGRGVASAGAGAGEGDAVRAEEPVGAGGFESAFFRVARIGLVFSAAWPEQISLSARLAQAAASTVIGLTTGLFGTAQISLAISAAEREVKRKQSRLRA